ASRQAVVVGAGLAGASVAAALAALGWVVTVFDRQPQPAAEASGNPAGLFHGTLHADDGPHARLFRAAALLAERRLRPLIEAGAVRGQIDGLLRLGDGADALPTMRALLQRQRLPADYVQALDRDAVSQKAGVALARPGWFYPGGGWLAPADAVRHWLAREGVRFVGGVNVAALRQSGDGWQVLGADGTVLADTAALVLANAGDAERLLAPLGQQPWALRRTRGQVSGWQGMPTPLRLPVAGDGYALPWGDGLLCGATVAAGDDEPALRDADHHHNFERLQRLTGLSAPADGAAWSGRVGWRLAADDRLPLVGAVPLPPAQCDPKSRRDQVRWLARWPGLYVASALGARGITLAPLLGELLAARIAGLPLPLEQDLVDAIDPGRWAVRAARRAKRG
ncbi:MAG: FAD-dependent 5-carboxymethylaminomethyl-2-thiouridine(34) oxidoreductase MnmC, partial [Rubrivivax sp.]|nr:FAD-dependent 5-carboxymethylaminomethyl-2-thiouridine(34) oxidoreductase MnmC [Rubrivivax sp.]